MSERIYRAEDQTNPAHYRKGGQEAIDAMRTEYGDAAVYAFCKLNAFKYRWRAGDKVGESREKDLAKADWYEAYANHLIDPEHYPDPRDKK